MAQKIALLQINGKLVMREYRENLPELLQVFALILAINEYVVEVYHHKSPDEGFEDLVHDAHKCAWCVGEAKQHDQPLI